jgi:hypothetical protein
LLQGIHLLLHGLQLRLQVRHFIGTGRTRSKDNAQDNTSQFRVICHKTFLLGSLANRDGKSISAPATSTNRQFEPEDEEGARVAKQTWQLSAAADQEMRKRNRARAEAAWAGVKEETCSAFKVDNPAGSRRLFQGATPGITLENLANAQTQALPTRSTLRRRKTHSRDD